MKNFVKTMNNSGNAFRYLKQQFTKISGATNNEAFKILDKILEIDEKTA